MAFFKVLDGGGTWLLLIAAAGAAVYYFLFMKPFVTTTPFPTTSPIISTTPTPGSVTYTGTVSSYKVDDLGNPSPTGNNVALNVNILFSYSKPAVAGNVTARFTVATLQGNPIDTPPPSQVWVSGGFGISNGSSSYNLVTNPLLTSLSGSGRTFPQSSPLQLTIDISGDVTTASKTFNVTTDGSGDIPTTNVALP